MSDKPRYTALITGGARRIGRATALTLAQSGMDVVVHYRSSKEAAKDLAGEIESLGSRVWTICADLAKRSEAEMLVKEAVELAGPLHVLINSASYFPKNRVTDFSGEELDLNIQVNAFSPLVLSRAFSAQGSKGTIINFLDSRIADYDAEHAAYHLSKRMLFTLTRMLALELAPRIRVNAVAPGLVLPPPGEDTSYLEQNKHTNPLMQYGSLKEVTDAVLFLVNSDFITGQLIFVDGGRHLKTAVYSF